MSAACSVAGAIVWALGACVATVVLLVWLRHRSETWRLANATALEASWLRFYVAAERYRRGEQNVLVICPPLSSTRTAETIASFLRPGGMRPGAALAEGQPLELTPFTVHAPNNAYLTPEQRAGLRLTTRMICGARNTAGGSYDGK